MSAAETTKPERKEPRLFTVIRHGDESGVSGTGRVMDGVVFHNGLTVVCWRTDVEASEHGHTSVGTYISFEAFQYIHIDSHPTNNTEIRWLSLTSTVPDL